MAHKMINAFYDRRFENSDYDKGAFTEDLSEYEDEIKEASNRFPKYQRKVKPNAHRNS